MKRTIRRRFYRAVCSPGDMAAFAIREEESDLFILADSDLSIAAREELRLQRGLLKGWIEEHPAFYTSFSPVPADGGPEIVRMMAEAAMLADTGPMAAVAGATAELVGRRILTCSSRVIVENGGDIFLCTRSDTTVALYAGESPFSMKIGIQVPGDGQPHGIATSSGTVGHSYSRGNADAVTVICRSAALADAAATRIANAVHCGDDMRRLGEETADYPFIEGIVAIRGKEIAAWGNVSLVSL